MAKPDDDHVPTAITDDSGELIAVAHMAPDASDEARRAMAEVAQAAIRYHESRPDRAEMDARQAAARERIRERNRRIFKGRHFCDDACVCPVHSRPLLYWPSGDEHACQDPDCRYAHGLETAQ